MTTGPLAVEIRAPAKVNLVLRVLERGGDEYHRIETLFQSLGLFDRLRLQREERPGVELSVAGAELGAPEDNLVSRAALAFLERAGLDAGVSVQLTKAIPAGAGLGGGSSDAAAALEALNLLFDEPLARDELAAIARTLGADVPFFLCGAALALGEGRGDRLTPLDPLPQAGVLLGLPRVHVSTAEAYRALAEARARGVGPATERASPLRASSWSEVAALSLNDFESVVPAAYPEVAQALAAVRATAPPFARLSGSGGAVFGVYDDLAAARRAAAEAARLDPTVPFEAVSTLTRPPAPAWAKG